MAGILFSDVLRFLRRQAGSEAEPTSDAGLLQRFAQNRDESAFEELVRRHGPLVLGVCRQLLADPHEAEDAFQATFLVLARRAASIKQRELLAGWLYAVAYRVSLRARARAARRAACERQGLDLEAVESRAQPGVPDLRLDLHEELARLPEKYRFPVVLCYLEEKTYEEAARELGWPVGTVSIRLTRARALLARRLTRRGLALPAAGLTVSAVVSPALARAAGEAVSGGVPATVTALAEGVMRSMSLSKLKSLAALALLVLVAGAATVLAQRPREQADPLAAAVPAAPPQAPGPVRPAAPPRAAPALAWKKGRLVETDFGRIDSLRFTPDGKAILLHNRDGFHLWDLATRKERRITPWRFHDSIDSTDVVTLDGKTLGTAGKEGGVRVWDLTTGKLKSALDWPPVKREKRKVSGVVTSGTISSDCALAASGLREGLIKVWDVAERKELREITAHTTRVASLAFSPNGKTLASIDSHGELKLWDTATGKERVTLQKQVSTRRASWHLRFSPDGKTLLVFGDADMALWDLATGKRRATLPFRTTDASAVSFSRDGSTLAVLSGPIRLVDLATGKALAALAWEYDLPCVAISPDGKSVVSSARGDFQFWEASLPEK